jgi:exodeoxyribonuclease VII small subunit
MMKTFKEAYAVLNGHAQTLRSQQEPNIDDLLNIVTESVEAYKVCKQRIDAVDKALEKALADPALASDRGDDAQGAAG